MTCSAVGMKEGERGLPGSGSAGAARSAVEMRSGSRTLEQMSFDELRWSVERDPAPPSHLSTAVQALWHDARDDWDSAHACAQADESREGSWVHAYLHRKEGDTGNAGYWYRRADRAMPAGDVTLAAEWAAIAQALLAPGSGSSPAGPAGGKGAV